MGEREVRYVAGTGRVNEDGPVDTVTDDAAEVAGTELVAPARVSDVGSAPAGGPVPWSARTDTTVRWVGWHLGEITVVGGTAWLAFATHPAWSVVTGLAVAGWVANERAIRRRARKAGAGEDGEARHGAA